MMRTALLLIMFLAASTGAEALQLIIGHVADAADGTSPNGMTVRIWKPTNASDFKEGTVINNIYAINCGSPGGLHNACVHGDTMYARVMPSGRYTSRTGWTVVNVSDGSPSTDTINLTLIRIMPWKISMEAAIRP